MKTSFKKKLVATCVLAAASTGVYAGAADTTVDLGFRYRIETVDQTTMDAEASTLRTRATIKTSWTSKIDTVIEFDDVSVIGMDDYNAGLGTNTEHSVIVDPEGTEVNQSFIRYNGESVKVAFGRQRILLANQRHVGGVGWRQNEQTFDSFTMNKNVSDNFSFSYNYVFNVNRIFGETVAAGDNTHDTHLLNLDYKLGSGKLTGYFYSIDNENVAAASNNTYGLRYAGKVGDFSYTAELASQSEEADNTKDYSANYYLLEGNYKVNDTSFGLGYEVLGGDVDGGQGFTTSLATLHAFQGWADKFLVTPAAGIEDLNLNVSTKLGGFGFKFVHHDFSSDQTSADLGTEFDMSISKKFSDKLSGLFKYANYNDVEGAGDVEKMWIMLSYNL